MMNFFAVWLFMLLVTLGIGQNAHAHDMTPTYPKFTHSHLDGVVKTTMSIFNKRQDVQHYEIKVFDKDFNSIPFVTSQTVIKLDYLAKTTFDVYVRRNDANRVTYICSLSKLTRDDSIRTAVSSRICSKIKNE